MPNRIAGPILSNTHPDRFAARHGRALQSLRNDHVAHTIIEPRRGALMLTETADRGVLGDTDTPAAP